MWLVEARRREVNHGTVSAMILIIVFLLFLFPPSCFASKKIVRESRKRKWQTLVSVTEPPWDVSAWSWWLWWAWRGSLMCFRGPSEDRTTFGNWWMSFNFPIQLTRNFFPRLRYFSDIVNSLQGLFIFIVVGCQPQVRNSFVLCSLFALELISCLHNRCGPPWNAFGHEAAIIEWQGQRTDHNTRFRHMEFLRWTPASRTTPLQPPKSCPSRRCVNWLSISRLRIFLGVFNRRTRRMDPAKKERRTNKFLDLLNAAKY